MNKPPKAQPPTPENETFELVLVRHAQAAPREIEAGGPNLPLTPLGYRQAELVARRLSKEHFDCIYSSDAARAHQTALAIVRYHRKTPFTVTKEAHEVMTYHNRADRTPPTPQIARNKITERKIVDRFIRRIFRRHRPGQSILIVCHGQLIKLLIALLAGIDPHKSVNVSVNNTSVTRLAVNVPQKKLYSVRLANCVRHLAPRQVT